LKLQEKYYYMGWPNCLRLYNSEIEMVIASDIGLRILFFGFIKSKNIFYLSANDQGKIGGSTWRNYGGHRLAHAPEAIPRTYCPDNETVSYSFEDTKIIITQPKEEHTGIVKQMEITMSEDHNQVRVLHRLINQSLWSVKLSPWAISALAPGGKAIIPQEPFGIGNDFLLPTRSISVWSYTNMQDPRWFWGKKYIQVKHDETESSGQKIGILNKQCWAAYNLDDNLLIKYFEFDPNAEYPDYGSNNEIYLNGSFLELETLGPIVNILPGGNAEHIEYWFLSKGNIGNTEETIDKAVLQKISANKDSIKSFRK
jgi:hypothetical protein